MGGQAARRRLPARRERERSVNVAAIDIGTNSCRLLIVDAGGATLVRQSDITRLGAGVDATGRLDDVATERTIDQLRRYRGVLDHHHVGRGRAVATSAVRDAANGAGFLDAAEHALGIRPELLSGDEEGRLAFAGATAGRTDEGPVLVIDVGGGSTEFIVGEGGGSVEAISIDIGCVRLTEAEFHHDPPRPEELSNAVGAAQQAVEEATLLVPAIAAARTVIGVAGTVTTMAAIELGMNTYDRDRINGFHLTRAAAEDVFRTMATESLADRVHNPGLRADRADVIVAGCAIVVSVFRHLHLSQMIVSEDDLLDALADSVRRSP